MSQQIHIIIGITGSVAAVKTETFIQKLTQTLSEKKINVEFKIIATESSKYFINKSNLQILEDENEFKEWKHIGDKIAHISLRQWADMFIILPLTANTLAKLSTGLCDNLLTNVARTWDFEKPIIVCPAMNTYMWKHPITSMQINQLKSYGYKIIYPIEKKLACGEFGIGGLEDLDKIIEIVIDIINSSNNLKKEKK